MLKLREPFSQKIHLHIKQDMLQGLWEKYVPASSPGYEQIQLIYLDQQYGPEEEQPKQIQLLIRLVLQNRMMQMGLEKYPSSLAYGVKRMEHSLHRVEKYYLTQLRSSNFGMFRTLNRYMTALEQEELANRRYSGWKKEHAAIEKQWEEYRLLSLFSVQVKEFLEERSRQMPRTLERKLFASLPEAEYQALAEESVWQEKDKLIAYLRTCDETQRRQIVEHLKKETELCRTLALKTGISETGRKEKRDIREKDLGERFAKDRFSKLKFSGKRYAKIKPEKEEATIGQILKSVPGQSMGERLAKAAELFDRKEFWLFCRKAVDLETADCQMVIWKRNREEMISYISQADTEQLQKLLAQLDTVYSEKMIRLQKQHSQELIRDFREHIAAMAKEEPFERIADMVYPEEPFEEIADMVYSAEPGNQTDKGTAENPPVEYVFEESGGQRSSGGIHRFVQKIEQTQEIWKERIRQREAQAFETYGDLYREALKDKISKIRQEDIESLVEDTFRNQQKENIYQENITEEEVRNICEWGRIFLESIGTENPVEAANGESLLAEHQGETQHTENPAEDAGRGLIPAEPEYQEELVYLFEKVGRQMESQNIQRETDVLAISRRLEEGKAESLKKLLGHIHTLEEGQKEEFTTWLAEAVIIWRQVYAARESLGKITADVMDVLRQEGLQNAAGQEEAGHLVKEAFLRRHKESIYREQVAEEEIRSICEWGRVFLESVDTVRREKAADAGRQEKVTDTEYPSEARYTEYPAEAAGRGFLLTEPEHPAEAQYTENPAEDAGRGFLPAEPEYQEELVYLFEKVGRQMESQNIHRETTDVLAISRRLEEGKAESLKKLLGHIHTLEEGQKEEFTTWLAEAVIIWRQVYAARESLGKITADVMDVLRQEGLQNAIGQEEAEHLVKEAFLRRHRESIYREQVAEEEIRSICEWGRVFLESVDTVRREKAADAGRQEKVTDTEYPSEARYTEYPAEAAGRGFLPTEPGHPAEAQYTENPAEAAGRGLLPAEPEYREELVYLFEKVGRQMESQNIHRETTNVLAISRRLEEGKAESLKKLLGHIHTLEEGQKEEFTTWLAEAVIIWRQVYAARESLGKITVDVMDVPGQAYTAGEPLGGRIAGVMDVPGQEGLQKAIGQEEAGHLVEEAFLRRHKESVYQEHMTEEEIRSVCEWGRVFLESVDTAYRTEISDTGQNMESQMKDSERLEQKEELIHLIRQINQHIEEKSIHGENLTLSWQESQLEEEKTENLLTHIHELKEEERTEFVRKLADAVLIWRQMDILARSFKETSADAFSALEQEAFPVIAGQEAEEQSADAVLIPQPAQEEELWPAESEKTGVPYQELWEWGEALLFHPEQEWEDGDILPVQRQEELSFSQDGSQEDMQTQIIRRQIEAAKDRNSLQRLVMQINHQIESGQEAQGIKESLQMQEPFLLVYTDSQLQASPIQRLVSHIRTLDEEQYGILVEELSRITKLQWLSHSRQEGIAKASDKQEGIAKASDKQEGIAKASDRQEGIAKASDKQKEMSLRTEENLPDAVLEHLDHKDEQEVFGKALPIGHKQVGKLAAAYPGLAWRIQEYERQRRRMVRQHIQELTQYPSYESGGRMPQGSGNRQEDALLEGLLSGSYRKRSGELPDGLPSGNYLEGSGELQQELRHFIQKNDASDENQQKTEMRMRQEAIQIKSAQEQLDRKLKEVEEELKKVESSAKAKEDVNVLAEQVKKQLYEELHVERLRRGLA